MIPHETGSSLTFRLLVQGKVPALKPRLQSPCARVQKCEPMRVQKTWTHAQVHAAGKLRDRQLRTLDVVFSVVLSRGQPSNPHNPGPRLSPTRFMRRAGSPSQSPANPHVLGGGPSTTHKTLYVRLCVSVTRTATMAWMMAPSTDCLLWDRGRARRTARCWSSGPE